MAGLLLGTKQLPEPVIVYYQLNPEQRTWVKLRNCKIQKFSFRNMHFKMSSQTWQPFCFKPHCVVKLLSPQLDSWELVPSTECSQLGAYSYAKVVDVVVFGTWNGPTTALQWMSEPGLYLCLADEPVPTLDCWCPQIQLKDVTGHQWWDTDWKTDAKLPIISVPSPEMKSQQNMWKSPQGVGPTLVLPSWRWANIGPTSFAIIMYMTKIYITVTVWS